MQLGRHRPVVALLLITASSGAAAVALVVHRADAIQQLTPRLVTGASSQRCAGTESLSVRLKTGARWSLCWTIDRAAGLRLSQVEFVPRRGRPVPAMRDAALAQIHVPYDNGSVEHLDLPGFGILTAALRRQDCPGKRLPQRARKKVLCVMVDNRDLRYAWSDYDFGSGNHTLWGSCVTLLTMTPADWYTYITRWRLCDDGSIRAEVGAGGTLAPRIFGDAHHGSPLGPGPTRFAVSHYHNVFWRLEFAGAELTVAQYDLRDEGRDRRGRWRPLGTESLARSRPGRRWAVMSTATENADRHATGFEIDLHNPDPYRGVRGRAFADRDVYATQYHECEILAANNLRKGCEASVDRYVDGEALERPILWVQTSFHHVPRDEDEPVMNEHWQGFTITARNLTATNPFGEHRDRR